MEKILNRPSVVQIPRKFTCFYGWVKQEPVFLSAYQDRSRVCQWLFASLSYFHLSLSCSLLLFKNQSKQWKVFSFFLPFVWQLYFNVLFQYFRWKMRRKIVFSLKIANPSFGCWKTWKIFRTKLRSKFPIFWSEQNFSVIFLNMKPQ